MKKQLKDPRKILTTLSKISLLLFFLMPFVYFTIKSKNVINIIIILVGIFLFIYFQTKKIENILYSTLLGYFFSGTWFFIAIVFLTGGVKENTSLNFILLIVLLLIFSLILFYLSNRSFNYETKELKIKRKFDPRIVFLIFILLSLIRGFLTFINL